MFLLLASRFCFFLDADRVPLCPTKLYLNLCVCIYVFVFVFVFVDILPLCPTTSPELHASCLEAFQALLRPPNSQSFQDMRWGILVRFPKPLAFQVQKIYFFSSLENVGVCLFKTCITFSSSPGSNISLFNFSWNVFHTALQP